MLLYTIFFNIHFLQYMVLEISFMMPMCHIVSAVRFNNSIVIYIYVLWCHLSNIEIRMQFAAVGHGLKKGTV